MAGLIPNPFLDELLNRTDIVELIDSYVPLKKRGNNHLACCPFHNEKTPSFNVVPKKQFYHCFGCGASGNAISFVMSYQNLGFVDAVETLATRLGMDVPREGHSEGPKPSPGLYQLLSNVSDYYQHTLKASGQQAIEYLKNRHISGQTAQRYQLGYAPAGWHTLESQFRQSKKDLITTGMLIQNDDNKIYDRYRHRITFPIHDRHGRIIGFGGRAIDPDQNPKYLNSPETIIFQKNRELYGLYQATQQENNLSSLIVVEGYMDVIALAQHGIHNTVATLGTATSSYHIQLLSKHTSTIKFCFDGDKAGRQAAWRALENALPHLNAGLEIDFIFLPEGHDPDSFVHAQGKDGFLQYSNEATSFNQFFFSMLTKDIDSSSLAGKSQLVNAAKPYLMKMNDGPYRQLIIDELARMTRIDAHRINQLTTTNTDEKIIDSKASTISRTPIRIAIALLIQHPELVQHCNEHLSEDAILDGNNPSVLKSLMQQIANNPEISTAALVESWRETPIFDSLNKLATWDHQVPENALKNEFIDIVFFLAKQNREKKITYLLEKSRNEGLTDEDRHELQQLLKQKHQTFHDGKANLE